MDVESSKEWFSSILHEDVEAVQKNAEQRAGTKTEDGDTGLLLATKSGLVKVVSVLARYESGHRDAAGLTALAIGILEGKLSICKLLAPYEACVPVLCMARKRHPWFWHWKRAVSTSWPPYWSTLI